MVRDLQIDHAFQMNEINKIDGNKPLQLSQLFFPNFYFSCLKEAIKEN
jgi:hypothetical protein